MLITKKKKKMHIWLVAGLNRYWIIFLWNKEIELRYDFFLFLNNSVHFVDEYFCDLSQTSLEITFVFSIDRCMVYIYIYTG